MSKILNYARGSFYVSPNHVRKAMVTVQGLSVPSTGCLVTDFSMRDAEKNAIIQCFNGVNHVYAFGHDPETSQFSVTYSVFLGNQCMHGRFQDSGRLARIIRSYNSIKLSSGRRTVNVTFGNGLTIVGIVLSADARVQDAGLNIVSVTISGKSMYMV